MVYPIVWTPKALQNYEHIVEYLIINFSEKEVQDFSRAIQKKIDLIVVRPRTYRRSPKKSNIHYTIVLGKVLFVYRFRPRKKYIEIIQLWDARQNPRKFKF